VDADQRRRVVRHDSHPHLDDCAALAFVGEVRRATAQQAGDDAFDHGSAVATGVGKVYLAWGPCSRQVPLARQPQNVLRRGRRGQGFNRVRDPHRENSLLMQCLMQGGIIERQIAGQRVEGGSGGRCHSGNGPLHVVDQGLHIAGVTGIPHRQMQAKDEAGRWLGDDPGFAAKVGRAIALPFANGRNRDRRC
jgi:hypothetical protein